MKLILHGEEIEGVFDLLGYNENGLTYALGWILSNNKALLKLLVKKISDKDYQLKDKDSEVRLQEFGKKDRGFTDIELLINNELFAIIEAKVGWNLPKQEQLNKYSPRFNRYKTYEKRLVVISECRKEYAMTELEKLESSFPIDYISWLQLLTFVERVRARSNIYQKKMLNSLSKYFKKVISMRDKNSNKVFCVSLAHGKPTWSRLSWIDIVEKKRRYFYPVGKNWPSDPPNYIAFRYDGKMQSIHHVDDYETVTKMYEHLPVDKEEWDPHFLLKLGKPFKPTREVKNGRIFPSQHLWFDLDTIFTCSTIKEARDVSQKRQENI